MLLSSGTKFEVFVGIGTILVCDFFEFIWSRARLVFNMNLKIRSTPVFQKFIVNFSLSRSGVLKNYNYLLVFICGFLVNELNFIVKKFSF